MTDFVQDTLTPLSEAVGEAWARGEIGLHEEHVYTEVVQGLLRDVIANLSDPRGQPLAPAPAARLSFIGHRYPPREPASSAAGPISPSPV